MKSFIVMRPRRANYTPADLMFAYAKDSHSEYVKAVRGAACGELHMIISGVEYKYHHWQIDELLGGIDRITVFLEEVKA